MNTIVVWFLVFQIQQQHEMNLTKTQDYISDINGQCPVALLMAIPRLTPEMMKKK